MLVFIEPEVKPGEVCDLIAAREKEDAHFEVQQTEQGLTVFPSQGCASIAAFQNGRELGCGHQRPANWE